MKTRKRLVITDRRKFDRFITILLGIALAVILVVGYSTGLLVENPEDSMSSLEKYPTQQDWIDEVNSWEYSK